MISSTRSIVAGQDGAEEYDDVIPGAQSLPAGGSYLPGISHGKG